MKKSLGYLKLIFVIVTMGYIFFLSSQSGKESNELSYKFMIQLKDYIESAKWITPSIKEIFFSSPGMVTRKLAHIAIYFILGLGVYLILPIKWAIKNRILIGITICILYAITDEIHQMFIPNRSAQILDIIIDSIGGIIGISVGVVINKVYIAAFKVK